MNKIHDGLAADAFTAPDSVKKATLCSKTGKLASSGCAYAKSGYFVAGNIPAKFCKNAHGGTEPSVSPSASPTASPTPTDGGNTQTSPAPNETVIVTDSPVQTPTPPPAATPTATPKPTATPVISLD